MANIGFVTSFKKYDMKDADGIFHAAASFVVDGSAWQKAIDEVRRDYAPSAMISRPISQRLISLVPAPIS